MPSKGVRRTLVVSKSSGRARDLSTLSRSFVVRRLSLARLERKLQLERHRKHASELGEKELPVLEPHLNLTGRQSGNLPRQTLPMCSVGMCLASELAHEESSLVMSQAIDQISILCRGPTRWSPTGSASSSSFPTTATYGSLRLLLPHFCRPMD